MIFLPDAVYAQINGCHFDDRDLENRAVRFSVVDPSKPYILEGFRVDSTGLHALEGGSYRPRLENLSMEIS